ncbi:MAG: VOC family protein [Acidimicrobiales bacterium]
MPSGIRTVIYPSTDIVRAKALYGRLAGVDPYMDEPYYVGFSVNGQDVGLDPHGHHKGMTGPVSYWHVDDINATLQDLLDAGAAPAEGVHDVGEGKLVASVTDADGNTIGLIQLP